MKNRKKIIIIVIVLFIILLFPIRQTYFDGGTTSYTSLLYKVINWKILDGKKKIELYIFPYNFKSIDEYQKNIDNENLKELILTSNKEIYSLNDKFIDFTIVNNTNKTLYTHSSPKLEIKTNNDWEALNKNDTVGFCGNKDAINNFIDMKLLLEWYNDLKEGNYRISFNIYNSETTDKVGYIVSKEFSLKNEDSIQKLNSVNCNNKDFEMSVSSDKNVYKATEKIKIWATLKYVGNKDNITIWHAGSADSDTYFSYLITDGKDFNSQSVTNLMLKSTVLNKDKLYYFDYEKSGGFSDNDPNANFWGKFYKEKDLYLPLGKYTVIVKSAFDLTTYSHNENEMICELKIKVEQ